MRTAETVLLFARLLESLVRRKLSSGVRRGAIGKVPQGNSLVAYPTSSTVLRGRKVSNYLPLPGEGSFSSDNISQATTPSIDCDPLSTTFDMQFILRHTTLRPTGKHPYGRFRRHRDFFRPRLQCQGYGMCVGILNSHANDFVVVGSVLFHGMLDTSNIRFPPRCIDIRCWPLVSGRHETLLSSRLFSIPNVYFICRSVLVGPINPISL